MKTLLSIGGETYLLPDKKDMAQVLETLKGITPVRSRTLYGPDGENRYSEEHGYCNKFVTAENQAKIKVELVLDDEVCTGKQFTELEHRAEQMRPQNLPVAA